MINKKVICQNSGKVSFLWIKKLWISTINSQTRFQLFTETLKIFVSLIDSKSLVNWKWDRFMKSSSKFSNNARKYSTRWIMITRMTFLSVETVNSTIWMNLKTKISIMLKTIAIQDKQRYKLYTVLANPK